MLMQQFNAIFQSVQKFWRILIFIICESEGQTLWSQNCQGVEESSGHIKLFCLCYKIFGHWKRNEEETLNGLLAHAKFQKPTCLLFSRKEGDSEESRKKERGENDGINNSLYVGSAQ